MARDNLDGIRRAVRGANSRNYEKQSGGPRSTMQVNDSSGVGGGSGGGNGYHNKNQQGEQKDQAEILGSVESFTPTSIRKMLALNLQLQGATISLEALIKFSSHLAQVFVALPVPLIFI